MQLPINWQPGSNTTSVDKRGWADVSRNSGCPFLLVGLVLRPSHARGHYSCEIGDGVANDDHGK